jgi:hypothetical protein
MIANQPPHTGRDMNSSTNYRCHGSHNRRMKGNGVLIALSGSQVPYVERLWARYARPLWRNRAK